MSVTRSQPQTRILATCKNLRQWDMEKLMKLLSELIKKMLLLVTDHAYKLREFVFINKTEAEIEIEVLNSLDSKNEVPTMLDT